MDWILLPLIGGVATLLGMIGCFSRFCQGRSSPIWRCGFYKDGKFLGTVIGELIAGKNVPASLRGGLGALLGFVLCVGLKLVSVGLFAWWYFAAMPLT